MLKKAFNRNVLLFILCMTLMVFIDKILIDARINEFQFMIEMVSQNTLERLQSAKNIVEISAISSDVSEGSAAQAEEFLLEIVKKEHQMWSHFLMADPTGSEFVHTEGSQHYGKSIAEREYFTTPNKKKKTTIAQPIHSVSTGRKIIAIGTPVYSNDAYSSVLVGFINLQYVSELLNYNSFSQNSYQLMSNADGTISAHPNEEYVLTKNISDLLSAQTSQSIMNRKSNYAIDVVEGIPSFVAYSPLSSMNLSVITVLPLHEAFFSVIVIDIILITIFIAIYFVLMYSKKLKLSNKYARNMALQAATDKLTGLKNRHWLENLDIELFCENTFTVIFFDVDNFKTFNDLNNHSYGDEVLRFIGRCMLSCTRPKTDISVRYAGDEFLIIFRDTEIENATLVANRLMTMLVEYVNADGKRDPIKISCGIASGVNSQDTLSDVISKADDAVYIAKKSGKNQIVYSQK